MPLPTLEMWNMAATIRVRKPLSFIYKASIEGFGKQAILQTQRLWFLDEQVPNTYKVVSKMVNQMGHMYYSHNKGVLWWMKFQQKSKQKNCK
jgi:hypothetical protein